MTNKLKVGFIVDEDGVSSYVDELIGIIRKNTDLFADAVLIVQKKAADNAAPTTLFPDKSRLRPSVILRFLILRLITRIELQVIKKYPRHADYLKTASINDIALEKLFVTPVRSKSGLVYRYDDGDLTRIGNEDFGVLIRCGKGILKGDILSIAEFGILSFHHGDNRVNRGLPSGFWEVYLSEPSTGFVIQKLSEELDGGDVLFRGNIMTQNYWRLNNAQLLKKSNVFMANLLKKLAIERQLPSAESKLPYSRHLFRSPQASILFRYFFQILFRAVKQSVLLKLPKLRRRWGVAYLPGNGLDSVMFKAKTIPNPPGRYLADPFVVEHENQTVCFVEDYFCDQAIGKISAYQLGSDGHQELGIVLEEDFHLSFPFIFKYEGRLFMCPETTQKKEIRIYESVDFPTKWQHCKTLMENVSAADTMLFERNNCWYMLTNICSAKIYEHHSELHLFSASSPLSDSWTPCPTNPIIFDSRKARNGGYFTVGDDLYRVNQVQGKAFYGKYCQVNLVQSLDENFYEEKLVCDVKPGFFPDIRGTHHYQSNGNWCVFDFLRFERY